MADELRMYSSLIVVVYYWMIAPDILNQDVLENLGETVLVIIDLEKVFSGNVVMLIVLYQMKRQLGCLLNLVHLECRCALPNMEDVL